jgi:hypothetical protein
MLTSLGAFFSANPSKGGVLLSTYWDKFGVGITQNLYKLITELFQKGLISPLSAVQVCFEPSAQTPHHAGFSCFYPIMAE